MVLPPSGLVCQLKVGRFRELPGQDVGRDRVRVVRVGREPEAALLARLDAVVAHEPLDPLLGPSCRMHPMRADRRNASG
jgi:hypothetical protein